jgi:general secretion pathway protein N
MNAAAQRRLTPPLIILAGVLGVLWLALWAGLGRGVRWDAPHPTVPSEEADTGQTPLPAPPPLAQFAAVWTQPLFHPQRRPQTRSAAAGNPGDLQLTGIILTPTLHMALLRARDGSEVRVREGGELPGGGVTLVEVRPRTAVFEGAGGRIEMELPAGAPIDAAARGGATTVQEGAAPATASRTAAPASATPAPTRIVAGGDSPDRRDERPHPDATAVQAARVQQLKAIIQQRRAAQAADHREGDR